MLVKNNEASVFRQQVEVKKISNDIRREKYLI